MTTSQTSTMGIDQYGRVYHNLGRHPRKALLDRLGRNTARKMYVDKKSGGCAHIGYIIGGLCIELYNVTQWERPA